MEATHEQNRATIEAVFALDQKFERKFEDLRRHLTLRIESLEGAVRKNSEDIRQDREHRGQNASGELSPR